jgi:hypothetical protein
MVSDMTRKDEPKQVTERGFTTIGSSTWMAGPGDAASGSAHALESPGMKMIAKKVLTGFG